MEKHEMPIKGEESEFAFLHKDDGFNAYEWEEMEREQDRAWYDADEDSNIRYGTDYFADFMQGPTEEEKA